MKECNQCGKCCINYGNGGLSASDKDLENWELFRPDIYAYVHNNQIWFNPSSGETLRSCPWLRKLDEEKYGCDIYLDRPEDCRHYPVTISDMIKDECEMLELKDLEKPKLAQQVLDKIMEDSRPPLGS